MAAAAQKQQRVAEEQQQEEEMQHGPFPIEHLQVRCCLSLHFFSPFFGSETLIPRFVLPSSSYFFSSKSSWRFVGLVIGRVISEGVGFPPQS